MTYTPERIIKSIEREIGFRKRLYSRKVADQSMTAAEAAEEIAIFEQIAADYYARVDDGAPKLL